VNVGGARDQIVGSRVRDARERAHAAGGDHHAVGEERAARKRCSQVALGVGQVGERGDLGRVPSGLVADRHLGARRHDEVRLDVGSAGQDLDEPHAVDRAGSAGDADDDALRAVHSG
jgi:hypothetical protein